MNLEKSWVATLIMLLGIVLVTLSQVSGVGYVLFLWGHEGIELSAAVWGGFVLWLKLLISGLITLTIGFIL